MKPQEEPETELQAGAEAEVEAEPETETELQRWQPEERMPEGGLGPREVAALETRSWEPEPVA